ncbi:hypothetical protein V8G54_016725 [Vigna mungo]|uniref:Uncharacterized protein n=1 Tax=Vigna mungo TaxID=3915 RepID=A0AAQ3NKQ5_VIGMU
MAQKEGAFPVQVIDFRLSTLQSFACHHFLEPFLHTPFIVLFRQPLHTVHQLYRYSMIHHLKETPVLARIFYLLHRCSSLFIVKVLHVNNWKILHFSISLSATVYML